MPEPKTLTKRGAKASKASKEKTGRKMNYMVMACNALAVLLSVSALAISIASVASDDWSHYTGSNMSGLFMSCDYNGVCFDLDDVGPIPDWLYAVRAFFIIMILFGAVGCMFLAAAFFLNEKKHLGLVSAGLIVVAGIFGIVACAVYAMSTDDVIPEYWYGIGFALGWVSCWFFFIGGILLGSSGGNGDDDDDYDPHSSAA